MKTHVHVHGTCEIRTVVNEGQTAIALTIGEVEWRGYTLSNVAPTMSRRMARRVCYVCVCLRLRGCRPVGALLAPSLRRVNIYRSCQ